MSIALTDAALAQALHGALQPSDRQAYEAALSSWEGCPGFIIALLRAYRSTPTLGHSERLLAVLCLKNVVTRRWNQRRDDQATIADDEKAALRDALLAALDEPDQQIWAQLELLIAAIARLEGLATWPVLMPRLLEAASRPAPRASTRGLSALFRVVKQQASRRLLLHRKQFFALAAELLPRLKNLRHAHTSALLGEIAQRGDADAAAWVLAAGDASDAGQTSSGGAWTLRAAVMVCKLERQLLLHGWAHLHQHAEPCSLLLWYLELLEAVSTAQARIRIQSPDGGTALMALLLVPSKMLMEVQDLQPLAMAEALPRAIAFFLEQLAARPFTTGADSMDEKFLVRSLTFLRSALSTSAYLPMRQAPPQAHTCQEVLQAFFASPSLPRLVTALLTRVLPLSLDEYEDYNDDPEAFVFEEHLARETDSLRKCGEQCLLSLAGIRECRQLVQSTVLALSNEAAAAGLRSLEPILALESCYLALGIVLQAGQENSQLGAVLGTLRQHCAVAAPEHSHLLRRRAACLLGWILRAPQFARMAAFDPTRPSVLERGSSGSGDVGNNGGAVSTSFCDAAGDAAIESGGTTNEAAPLVFSMLSELLVDGHPGVRLAAALAVQALFDATDTSPRADAAPRTSGCGSSSEGAGGSSNGDGDPLAQLAAVALLPVLHLSLHVREISSRWRMGQLLCRLLARLNHAPSLLAPHLPALAQWLPTAWNACDGEQLLQEATLDAAATMLQACASPLLHPRLPLIAAALGLVSLAIDAPGSACAHRSQEAIAAASAAAAGGTFLGAAAASPPIGLVEIALRLWRACLIAIQRPLQSELAEPLLALAAHLPTLIELGDELMRPAMLLLDWYILADRTLGVCRGQFMPTEATTLAPILERALSSHAGKGSLAAIGSMHTMLLAFPEHAVNILQPALSAALTTLIAPEDDDLLQLNMLIRTATAGLLGRALLCAPALLTASLSQAAAALQMPDIHAQFANYWLSIVDSIALASQRKLACLALCQLVALDSALAPLLPDVLSFSVSVLAEHEAIDADGSAQRLTAPLPAAGEHAEFMRRLEASGLDPVPALSLRPALQDCLNRASASHGEAFVAQMNALDPALLQQVQVAFGLTS